jgi:hypothetical protein
MPVASGQTPGSTTPAPASSGQPSLGGLNFGVGIALTGDVGDNEVVREAAVVNGIVRVTDEDDHQVRIMFETHYFFPQNYTMPLLNKEARTWGFGPFIAFQPGEDQIITSVGMGVMLGFKRSANDNGAGDSFNMGLGVFVEPNSQILGEGLRANEPLPEGETEIRYKEESQVSWGVITSFSF